MPWIGCCPIAVKSAICCKANTETLLGLDPANQCLASLEDFKSPLISQKPMIGYRGAFCNKH